MANAKGRSLRLTHVQALRFHFAPRSKLICMMRQLTLSASLLALLCFFFLPDVTMRTFRARTEPNFDQYTLVLIAYFVYRDLRVNRRVTSRSLQ